MGKTISSKCFLLTLSIFFFTCKSSKFYSSNKQDLYYYVDSLITQVLNYEYNEDSKFKSILVDSSTYKVEWVWPKNPAPAIFLNGEGVSKDQLREYKMRKVQSIKVMHASDSTTALFGKMGTNGAVIIKTKKS